MSLDLIHKSDPGDRLAVLRKLHTCNVCGKIDFWQRPWAYKMVFMGKGYSGFEMEFKVCGPECSEMMIDHNLIEKFRAKHDPCYRKPRNKK